MTLTSHRTSVSTQRALDASPPGPGAAASQRTHLFVIGAGYVGLVTAVGMARLGHRVTVSDINETRIAGLAAGHVPIWEPGLESALREVGDRITFTTDPAPPAGARFSFVTVSTPLDDAGLMDLGNVLDVVRSLIEAVPADHVIVVRSTLMPSGPAALLPLRDDPAAGPALVTNPEFLREGSALEDFRRPGRIVAGWVTEPDRAAAQSVIELYDGIDAPSFVADARSVAMVKIASNVFLAMKVGFANELARLSDAFGADAQVVADGLGLDERIGRAFLDAGPGIGGSCLPEQAVAMRAVARAAHVDTPLIAAVATANDAHRSAICERLGHLVGRDMSGPGPLDGIRIAVLGLAFKANTDDVRQSAAMAIAAELRAAGASVVGTDPRAIETARRADPDLSVVDSVEAAVSGADAVLIATEWQEYRELDWPNIATRMRGSVVYDTRGVVDPAVAAAAGLHLERLGRPDPRRRA